MRLGIDAEGLICLAIRALLSFLNELLGWRRKERQLTAALTKKNAVIARQEQELTRLRPAVVLLGFAVFFGGMIALAYLGTRSQA